MNPDELRELDREMAERVMEWTLEEWSTSGVLYEPLYRTGPTSHLAVVAWRPTEDIRQARMVVEALQAKGWQMTLETHVLSIGVTMYRRLQRATGMAGRKQPALAICVAAKATEGAE